MTENADKRSECPPKFDPSIQTEKIVFAPEDLIACDGCSRMNPPTRLNCIYCAKELEVKIENAASIRHVLRKLELWESGFNIIVRERSAGSDIAKIARLLSMETENIAAILDAGEPLPLARVESENQALIIQTGLSQLGLKCLLVSDADLAIDKPQIRLSGIEFFDGFIALIAFNTGGVTDIKADDLALIVPGLITASRVDTLEKKHRRGKTKLIDETATASDESILDLYTRHNATGFRVHLAGFDYSCLGREKGLLAAENQQRLAVVLKKRAPNARLVKNYKAVRHALGSVWEIESRKDVQGLQRSGFGKAGFGSVTSTSNLNQFTKYSRLQWHLL